MGKRRKKRGQREGERKEEKKGEKGTVLSELIFQYFSNPNLSAEESYRVTEKRADGFHNSQRDVEFYLICHRCRKWPILKIATLP